MSAQTVFAIAVPSAPAAPQGSAGTPVATGFAALLATTAEVGGGGDEASADGASVSAPEGEIDETAVFAAAAAPFLPVAPVPAAPLALGDALAGEVASAVDAGATAAADGDAGAPSTTLPALAPVPAPAQTQAARQTAASLPAHGQVIADLGDSAQAGSSASPTTGTAEAADAQPGVAQSDAAANKPSPVATPLPAAPPPLRPLADRTSKPLDAAATASGEAAPSSRAGISDRAMGLATPADSGSVADKAGSAEGKTAATAAAGDASVEAETPETPPAADGARSAEASAALTRETSLSGLSRTTIEATAQIAAQILRRLEGRSTRFEMALLPEELGRVDVKLDIDSEGRLAARLAFDNPAAATDLRGRVDELRRQLEDAGFHLADDAFEFADRDSGSSAFDRGQDARGGSKRAFAAAQQLNAEADAAIPPRWMALSLSPSGVDVKV